MRDYGKWAWFINYMVCSILSQYQGRLDFFLLCPCLLTCFLAGAGSWLVGETTTSPLCLDEKEGMIPWLWLRRTYGQRHLDGSRVDWAMAVVEGDDGGKEERRGKGQEDQVGTWKQEEGAQSNRLVYIGWEKLGEGS